MMEIEPKEFMVFLWALGVTLHQMERRGELSSELDILGTLRANLDTHVDAHSRLWPHRESFDHMLEIALDAYTRGGRFGRA